MNFQFVYFLKKNLIGRCEVGKRTKQDHAIFFVASLRMRTLGCAKTTDQDGVVHEWDVFWTTGAWSASRRWSRWTGPAWFPRCQSQTTRR